MAGRPPACVLLPSSEAFVSSTLIVRRRISGEKISSLVPSSVANSNFSRKSLKPRNHVWRLLRVVHSSLLYHPLQHVLFDAVA
jgi:hypothetical protein